LYISRIALSVEEQIEFCDSARQGVDCHSDVPSVLAADCDVMMSDVVVAWRNEDSAFFQRSSAFGLTLATPLSRSRLLETLLGLVLGQVSNFFHGHRQIGR
jgi:hypothetical protein